MTNNEQYRACEAKLNDFKNQRITYTEFIDWHLAQIGKEVIICSAVMAEDGKIYRGHRHGDAMRACAQTGRKLFNGREQQGFITSHNRYVLREEARRLQDEAGIQSADPDGYRGKTLFSEDLYWYETPKRT